MRITALATGAGVPEHDFAGQLTEVHRRAALVKLHDGWCITLLGVELGRQPRGISLSLGEDISLRQFLSAHAKLAKRGGVIRFAGSALTIDLRQALHWRSEIATLQFDCRRTGSVRAHRTAWSALERDGRGRGLREIAGAKLNNLSEAIRVRDIAAAERAISGLIGFGEGKTPAGDDYLVGIFGLARPAKPSRRRYARSLRPWPHRAAT